MTMTRHGLSIGIEQFDNEFILTLKAIVGNQNWQKLAAKVGGWFVSGEVKHFADMEAAYVWLQD